MQTGQISLFSAGALLDTTLSSAFGAKEIKNNKGEVVGATVGLQSRKFIATQLGLTGRDNKEALDAKILESSDAGLTRVKGEIASLGKDWTLTKVANRTVAGGIRQITLVVREIKRHKGPSDEAIAQALNMTVEEVAAMRKRQQDALAAKTVDEAPQNGDDAAAVAQADAEYLALQAEEEAKAAGKK